MINCLEAVYAQKTNYTYEVIVVDNESRDIDQNDIIEQFPSLIWLSNHVRNPYDSRNKAIEAANGLYIVFLDAKGAPSQEWLQYGLDSLSLKANTLVAGKYHIVPASDHLKDHLYGLLYLNNQKNVQKGFGVTIGNLFVHRSTINQIGLFSTDHLSGNDIAWTKKALSENFVIEYVEDAVINYHGQSYEELKSSIKKYVSGIVHIEKRAHVSKIKSLKSLLKYLMPMRKSTFRSALQYRALTDLSRCNKCYLYVKIWRLKLIMARSYFVNTFNWN